MDRAIRSFLQKYLPFKTGLGWISFISVFLRMTRAGHFPSFDVGWRKCTRRGHSSLCSESPNAQAFRPGEESGRPSLDGDADVAGVDQVHDLHVWTVSSDRAALMCQVTLAEAAPPAQEMLCHLHEVLANRGINH